MFADFIIMAQGNSFIGKRRLEVIRRNRVLVALDGAANIMAKQNITPDIIIGDEDSIETHTKRYYQSQNTVIIHEYDQNKTDMEKGIIYCDQHQANSITIINAIGGKRTDHNLGNLSCLKKFYNPEREISILSKTEIIFFLKDAAVTVINRMPGVVGIFGFPLCMVNSTGLQYEMHNYKLELGVQESISNRLSTERAVIRIDGEAIIVVPASSQCIFDQAV